jgi:hypothetical protein
MSSHKFPECDGRWIDISTLARRQVMCLKCRAIVEGLSDPDDGRLAPRAIEEPLTIPTGFRHEPIGKLQEATEPGRSEPGRYRWVAPLVIGYLLGLLVAALIP